MKKVFLLAYPEINLGDDIFVTMLLERYPQVDFYINIPDKEKRVAFTKYKNIFFIENVPNRKDYERIEVAEYDALAYIGGSVFMENAWGLEDNTNIDKLIKRCKEFDKPFFYISSNFGPCKTDEYFKVSKSIISNCKDVCFRDKYSYNLFSDLSSVRYEPDLILGYDVKNITQQKDTVGISVIGFDIREELKEHEEKYYSLLENSIRIYIKEGKNIVLFSFCKIECDEIGIEKLLKRFSNEELQKIRTVKYDGDIKTFIDEFKNVEYMIATRFHSLILSAVCGHKIYCLSYSKKINNVIDDLNFKINTKNITEICDNDKIELESFNSIDFKIVEDCARRSKNQFREFEKIIKTNI